MAIIGAPPERRAKLIRAESGRRWHVRRGLRGRGDRLGRRIVFAAAAQHQAGNGQYSGAICA
jgi:hypothetical protein